MHSKRCQLPALLVNSINDYFYLLLVYALEIQVYILFKELLAHSFFVILPELPAVDSAIFLEIVADAFLEVFFELAFEGLSVLVLHASRSLPLHLLHCTGVDVAICKY